MSRSPIGFVCRLPQVSPRRSSGRNSAIATAQFASVLATRKTENGTVRTRQAGRTVTTNSVACSKSAIAGSNLCPVRTARGVYGARTSMRETARHLPTDGTFDSSDRRNLRSARVEHDWSESVGPSVDLRPGTASNEISYQTARTRTDLCQKIKFSPKSNLSLHVPRWSVSATNSAWDRAAACDFLFAGQRCLGEFHGGNFARGCRLAIGDHPLGDRCPS